MAVVVGSLLVTVQANSTPFAAGMQRAARESQRRSAEIRGHLDRMNSSYARANRTMSQPLGFRGLLVASRNLDTTNSRVNLLRTSLLALTGVMGGFSTALLVNQTMSLADSYTSLRNQLKTVISDEKTLVAVEEQLFNVAMRSRTGFRDTANFYTRLARSSRSLGLSYRELIGLTETVQKAFVVGGATPQEASSFAVQFSQGLASNRLGGEELRTVLETPLGAMLAKGMGVTLGQFREMGYAGELTAARIIDALRKIAPEIEQTFGKTQSTIAQAWIQIDNALTKYIGTQDTALGGTRMLVAGMQALADNIDVVAESILMVAGAMGSTFLGRQIGFGATGIQNRISEMRQERAIAVEAAAARRESAQAALQAARAEATSSMQAVHSQRLALASAQQVDAARRAAHVQRMQNLVTEAAAAQNAALAERTSAQQKLNAIQIAQKASHDARVARLKDAVEAAKAAKLQADAEVAASQSMVAAARTRLARKSGVVPGFGETAIAQRRKELEKQLRAASRGGSAAQVARIEASLAKTQAQFTKQQDAMAARRLKEYTAAVEKHNKALAAQATATANVTNTTARWQTGMMSASSTSKALVKAQQAVAAANVKVEATAKNLTVAKQNLQVAAISGAATDKAATIARQQLVELERQHAANLVALRAAQDAATVAAVRHNAALAATSRVAIAAGVAMRGLRAVMAWFGGPIGFAFTAISVALMVMATRASEAEQAAQRQSEALQKVVDLREQAARAEARGDREAAKRAEEKRRQTIAQEQLEQQTHINRLQRALEEEKRILAERLAHPNIRGAGQNATPQSVEKLQEALDAAKDKLADFNQQASSDDPLDGADAVQQFADSLEKGAANASDFTDGLRELRGMMRGLTDDQKAMEDRQEVMRRANELEKAARGGISIGVPPSKREGIVQRVRQLRDEVLQSIEDEATIKMLDELLDDIDKASELSPRQKFQVDTDADLKQRQAEVAALRMSTAAAAEYLAKKEMLARLDAEGIPLTAELISYVDRRAAAIGHLAEQEERFKNAKEANDAFDRLKLESAEDREQIQAEIDAMFMSTRAAAVYLKTQELINKVKKDGIPVTQEVIDWIKREAAAYGDLAEASEQADDTKRRMEELRDVGRDAFKSIADAMRDGKVTGKELVDVLNQIADKLFELAMNDIADILFGKQGSSGFGALGSLFGSLFGGAGAAGGGGAAGGAIGSAAGAAGGAAFHGGGIASRRARVTHMVPAAAARAAPRFHTGLGPKELLAVLEEGETVLTRKMTKNAGRLFGSVGSGSSVFAPVYNIDARNAAPGTADQLKKILEQNNKQIFKAMPSALKEARMRRKIH